MKPKGKIDWKQLFLFTKEGRIKNLDLIYGFFLGVALLAVSFAIGNRLTLLFETLLDGQTRTVKNLADTLVPMLLCLAIVWGLFRLIPKKIVVLLACWIVLLLTAVFLIAVLATYDRETLDLMFMPFFCMFGVPALADAALATVLYVRRRRSRPEEVLPEEEELPVGE